MKRAELVGVFLSLFFMACGSGISSGSRRSDSDDCQTGALGCPCEMDSSCNRPFECEGGICQAANCETGIENCPCGANETCSEGFECNEFGFCVSKAGQQGERCLANGTCEQGNRCGAGFNCESCEPGTLSCDCLFNDSCFAGLSCQMGRCVEEAYVQPVPQNPQCYSPCRDGFTDSDGNFRECSVNGLIEGCLFGKMCVNGSCVESEDDEVPECQTDVQCTDYQVCVNGTCLSNCEYNADCGATLECYRKSCRLPCTAVEDHCNEKSFCSIVDGDQGYCMPLAPPGDDPPILKVVGSLSISKTRVRLSNTKVQEVFKIVNESPIRVPVTIRKVSQSNFETDGVGEIREEQNPLPFLRMGQADDMDFVQTYEFELNRAGDAEEDSATIYVEIDGDLPSERWEGILEISAPGMGAQRVRLDYSTRPEGRWVGKVYYFNQFDDFSIDDWKEHKDLSEVFLSTDENNQHPPFRPVRNAFIRKWISFREGTVETLGELRAILTATVKESWKWREVQEDCESPACYLYTTGNGLEVYSESLINQPVPSGVVEFPIAIDIEEANEDGTEMQGRIVSSLSLHYAGDPAVRLRFAADPTQCVDRGQGNEAPVQEEGAGGSLGDERESSCIAYLSEFESTIAVGGRYYPRAGEVDKCRAAIDTFSVEGSEEQVPRFVEARVPWIVPGFLGSTVSGGEEQPLLRYKKECRDRRLPYGPEQDFLPANLSLAASNPIPDGKARVRHVEFLDGMLVNQNTMLILFREHFQGFTDSVEEDFSAYGIMELDRTLAQLDPEENPYEGSDQEMYAGLGANNENQQEDLLQKAACDPELLMQLEDLGIDNLIDEEDGSLAGLTVEKALEVSVTLITGVVGEVEERRAVSSENMHYLCHDTGLFDSGPDMEGVVEEGGANGASRRGCPAGGTVTYFTEDVPEGEMGVVPENLSDFPCQQNGTCEELLQRWIDDPDVSLVLNPFFECEGDDDFERRHCDTNRLDLLADKQFYLPPIGIGAEQVLPQLDSEIDNAFRYKTRFRNRSGQNIGFTPEICIPFSNAVPYCYDPTAIEKIQDRVDCIVHVYSEYLAFLEAEQQNDNDANTLNQEQRAKRNIVKTFLDRSFSYDEEANANGERITYDGFERLNAELLVMLGDEAYTNAFKSRFDLAGGSIASFEGSLFEPNGIDLAGVAGYEMYNLYQATQYFRLVIDRFYSLSPYLWKEIRRVNDMNESLRESFLNQKTVVTYIQRVLRASTQYTRAWSEIARRYQAMNRADLARFVIERSYTAAYIESIVISQLIKTVYDKTVFGEAREGDARFRDQLAQSLDKAARIYQAALLDMSEVYSELTDDLNFFGFSPEYVPLPALDPNGPNAFETLLNTAQSSARAAAEKEERAIQQNRSYETDSASFQSELARIRNTYENQLAEICGTFPGEDGNVYPATPKYAYQNQFTRLLGDPCGLVGNGDIFTAITSLEIRDLDIASIEQSFENVVAEIDNEIERAQAQCQARFDHADVLFELQGEINNLDKQIRETQENINIARRSAELGATVLEGAAYATACALNYIAASKDSKCIAAPAISFGKQFLLESTNEILLIYENDIRHKQDDILDLEASRIQIQAAQECELLQIDSQSIIFQKMLRLKELELEALKADYAFRLAQSEIARLFDRAKRIYAEQQETEQLSINVEAARNDPNVRIYKNDTIINAERAFQASMRNAYRATKVFEYYTSQSYPALNELTLVRMVSYGDYNLENYLRELEENYYTFLETAGRPDLRVDIISLRDDVLSIPYFDRSGNAIAQLRRTEMLREALSNPRLLNGRGYLVLPFDTSFERLSPLTRNHKVAYMEAEIIGSDNGDTLGRVYIAQTGTGVVHTLDGDKNYFRFPERTAVLNPFFNGSRVFAPEVYRNNRLRDRPFVNTNWDLVLNQRDERANQDINLNAISDIRIYVYYTDFTEF